MTSVSYLTPPAYAKRLCVDPSKVIGWIRRGELRAVNVADGTAGRPRYRISLDAICEFEARRSATTPAKAVKRRRRKKDDSFVKYF